MRYFYLLLISLLLLACNVKRKTDVQSFSADSLMLVKMVGDRVHAMQQKDLNKVMIQFSDDATFINSAGYYMRNKKEIEQFHRAMLQNDSISFEYTAGVPHIRVLSDEYALAYYSWKILWTPLKTPKETVTETGLISLTARKTGGLWYWMAVSNQHTPEYFNDLVLHRGK